MVEAATNEARGVLICANPFSGSGPNRGYVQALEAALSARGLDPKLIWDVEQRQAALGDPALTGWCRCVVVAGGDGSIAAVVNEVYRSRAQRHGSAGRPVALATLPMGTENLFAKYFGFTRDAERLAEAIHAGRTRSIDLGRMTTDPSGAGGELFTLMAGVGFDADVVQRMHRWRETHRGLKRVNRLAYLPRILSSLWRYRYPRVQVRVDGRQHTGAHLFVFNLPSYGGGLRLAPPGCSVEDGRLDWVLFERAGGVSMLRYALSVVSGRHLERKDVKHGRCVSLEVIGPAGAAVQLDGDPAGVAPVVFSVAERSDLALLIT